MNPFTVVTEQDLLNHLKIHCYEATNETSETGRFWKCMRTGKHILVPFPYEEMYPDFMLHDLEIIIGKVKPSLQ